jgi:hypothetical protein
MFAIDLTGAPWCNRVGSRSFWVNGRSSRPWFWQANPLSARLKPEKDCLGAHSGVELLCGYLERLLRSQILLERNMCLLLRRWFLWWSYFFWVDVCSLTCLHCSCGRTWGRWVGSSKHFLEEEKFRKRRQASHGLIMFTWWPHCISGF